MTDEAPDTVPFIQAMYRYPRTETIRLVVIHTTENPCARGVARMVAHGFASPTSRVASAHYVVGPDEVIACVAESDVADHAPPVNAYSIGVEHTAMAEWSAAQWATDDVQAMLSNSVDLVRGICSRKAIQLVYLDAAALIAAGDNAWGITTHNAVSQAYHKTNHWDPGPNWPMDTYMARLQTGA